METITSDSIDAMIAQQPDYVTAAANIKAAADAIAAEAAPIDAKAEEFVEKAEIALAKADADEEETTTVPAKVDDEATVERFAVIDESKLLKHLADRFSDGSAPWLTESAALVAHTDLAIMDSANVCMLAAKTARLKLLLRKFVSADEQPRKVPDLRFGADKGLDNTAKYSVLYLDWVIDLAKLIAKADGNKEGGSLRLSLKHDYPIRAETDDFIFILAPRVDND
jgi:hypothetical protein